MAGITQDDIKVLRHYADDGNRELYWNYLAHKQGNAGYGLLALGVVRNDNAPGATANVFADNQARSDGVRMSERQWNDFGVDLMQYDLERRQHYQRSGRPELALNLPVRDIEDVHDATFQKRNINPDAWTPRQLLDAARRHGGDAEAEKVWSMMLDNSALGLNRATQTVDDVRKYDDAQLDAASYVGRMTGARIQASQTLPITDPDRIGAPNFSYMYDRQTHRWNTWVSNGEQTVVQPVRDPQQLRELDDTRALRLERQQLRQQFHPDDPYRQQPVLRSPQTLAEADPARLANAELLAARASDPTLPDHPRHALHQQCVAGTQALDRQLGRSPDAASACMAASLTDLAARSGLDRVDRVLLSEGGRNAQAGERVFVVQGDPKDPDHRWAQMPTDEAVHTPVAQSFERLAEFDQQQALAQTQQAAMQQEVQQQAQRQGAVAIRI
ncbi:XVIPCD domain-containing protein [Xanthomonas translucens]|uniref:XVIPCD domain-containing protein n=1 Tax=Xanthomonas campestris pv. translucens TaxID=343 RepID=UPI001F258CC7|nr:XVIPCD domain-containing protein [Xanthomonas translucens]